ncbi:MAG: flagellar filament capping protein FliD, partial [Ktedonobacterales bacterium]|nr:flagellar filament capping protein FliD [Ktedonobacterales bacterium]
MSAPISSSSSTGATTGTTSTGTTTTAAQSGGTLAQPVNFSGLVSGIDTNSIIQKLLAVYTAPSQVIKQQQQTNQSKQAAWTDIKDKMTTLQTAVQALQAPAAAAAKTGTTTAPSGSTAAVTVTTAPNAAVGNFTVNVQSLATSGILTGAANLSAQITGAAATTSPLTGLGLGVTPTLGTVTVNGTAITIDSATGLLGSAGDTVQAKLAAAGVTMTAVTDVSGNVTGVTLTSATPLQLGAPGDTSNLLAALRLTTAAPTAGGTTVTSNGALAGNSLGTGLGSLRLATALTSTAGTLNVNGVSLTYTSADTLGSIIGKINQSNAGVTASYDALSDRMVLAAKATGMGGISVTDASGNLAAALEMTSGAGAVVTPGAPAVFTVSGINGGAPIASASNAVTGIIPGVTLNLGAVSPSMTPAGATVVTVAQNATAITTALQSFVTAYNALQDTMAKYTAIQTDNTGSVQSAGLLAGDPGLASLTSDLDQMVNDTTATLGGKRYSLASLGISTTPANGFVAGSVPSLDLQFTTATLTSA